MKQFLKDEFVRLVNKLPETDPSTSSYHMLLHSIEALEAIGSTIEGILEIEGDEEQPAEPFVEPIPFPKPIEPISTDPDPIPVPAPVEPPVVTEKTTVTAPEVRKALCEAKKRGVDVKAVLQKFYANNFQNLPEEKYADLMAALEVM